MNIIILTINSKEIIDFVDKNNGIEIQVDNKFYYKIINKNDVYYVWNDFTHDDVKNDEYLCEFREFATNYKNYDLFIFYKPNKMIKYKLKYINHPINTLEQISYQHLINIKNNVVDIFKDKSFVIDEPKLKKLEKPIKYDLLQNLSGDIYEINLVDKNFKNKFKNNICVIF